MRPSSHLYSLFIATWCCVVPGVFAQTGQAPDPQALYKARCAMCHELGVLAPTTGQIARLGVDGIEAAMWHGPMQIQANGLTRPERLALARWLAGDPSGNIKRDPGVRPCAAGQALTDRGEWSGWAPDNRFSRYVPDESMTEQRASAIRLAWAHPFPVLSAFASAANPVAVRGGVLYTGNLNHFVYALEAETGCALWTYEAEGRVRSNVVVSETSVYFADLNANVYALDAQSGSLRWRNRVDWGPGSRVTGNITVHGDNVFVPVSTIEEVAAMKLDVPCCTFRGAVVALDARNGHIRWKTHTIDQAPEYLGDNEAGVARYGPSGVPVWSGISVDRARGLLYVGNGNQFTEPAVVESDAVMALDMATGEKRWIRSLAPKQMGGQDIYHLACEAWWDPERRNCSPENPQGHGDRDIGAPPVLVTRSDGSDAVVVGTKDGMLYALDPDRQGAMLWSLRVGRGGEAGGIEYGIAVDGRYAYAPVVDMDANLESKGSLTAVDLLTGKPAWRVAEIDAVCDGKATPPCGNAVMTPPAVVGNVVFVGLIDGTLRAYATDGGRELWRFDTAREFSGINERQGLGGSLGNGGPVVVGNRLYIMSGFSLLNLGLPGNVLLAFDIPQ